jgi:hypothetical protein
VKKVLFMEIGKFDEDSHLLPGRRGKKINIPQKNSSSEIQSILLPLAYPCCGAALGIHIHPFSDVWIW